ncbi:MAG: hypothetical protein JXA89_27955 [Anaerolineae bacterium]|nr:hypothetical protein [Anaerolineae bacterium]
MAIIVVMALAVMLRSTGTGVSRTFFNVYLDDGLCISIAQIGTFFAVWRSPLLAAT